MRSVLCAIAAIWLAAGVAHAQVPPLPSVPPPIGATPTPEITPTPAEDSPSPSRPPEMTTGPVGIVDAPVPVFTAPVPDAAPVATAAAPLRTPAGPLPAQVIGDGMSLAGAYALSSGAALLAGVLLPAVLVFVRPARRLRLPKEVAMPASLHRWRLIAGAALIAVAAIVAIAGYLKISLEPDIARQVPYLASAGMATLILVVAGGALVMADQIRAEDDRITEIETAVARLADLIRDDVESPARLTD